MAQSAIDTRITLSGLDEVKAKAAEAGAVVEESLGRVTEATETGREGTERLGDALSELGEKLGLPVAEAEKLGSVFESINFTSTIAGFGAVAAAVAAAAVAFIALGQHAATATQAIENQATTLGIAAEKYEGLQFAAASIGVSTDAATRAFDRLSVKIGAAREEQEKLLYGANAFDSTKDIIESLAAVHGDFVDTLAATADKFRAIEDPARRATLGMQLFGRGWAEVAPLLNRGSKEIAEFREEWHRLGVSATEDEAKMAAAYTAASMTLKMVTEGLTNAIGNIVGQLFAPGMAALATALAEGQAHIRAFAEGFVEHVRPLIQIGGQFVRGFIAALNDLTAVINRAFGTNFSTIMVVATAALFAFARPLAVITGAFILVEAAIKAVFGPHSDIDAGKIAGYVAAFGALVLMIRSLASALALLWLNPLGAILAVALALGAALLIINGDTKAISEAIGKYLGEDAAKSFDGFVETVRGGWESLKTYLVQSFVELKADIDDWARGWVEAIDRVIDRYTLGISTILGLTKSLDFGGGGDNTSPGGADYTGFAYARGGRVPGSGFGDIVRALLTPGEFVHRVAAVRHYGLDFMQRLNNLQIPRFDIGGLVGSLQSVGPAQRFANGGMVEAMATGGGGRAPVHLHLDGRQFSLQTDEATADALVRVARGQTVRSAGKKPGWVS